MREVICILESNSSERSFQDAVEASVARQRPGTFASSRGNFPPSASTSPARRRKVYLGAAISGARTGDPDSSSCSTIATHLSRRIPVEPVTERASGRPRKLDPRPEDECWQRHRTFLSSFLCLSLSSFPSFSYSRGPIGPGGCCTSILTRTRMQYVWYARLRKKIMRVHTYVYVRSLGGYGITRNERGFPACGERTPGIVGEGREQHAHKRSWTHG